MRYQNSRHTSFNICAYFKSIFEHLVRCSDNSKHLKIREFLEFHELCPKLGNFYANHGVNKCVACIHRCGFKNKLKKKKKKTTLKMHSTAV